MIPKAIGAHHDVDYNQAISKDLMKTDCCITHTVILAIKAVDVVASHIA